MSIQEEVKARRHKSRRKIRAIYIRRCIICSIVAFLVGMLFGLSYFWFAGGDDSSKGIVAQKNMLTSTAEISDMQTVIGISTPIPTISVATPSVVDAKGNSWGTIENPFRIGNAYSLMADTTATGEAWMDSTTSPFASQNLSISLMDFYTPEYYEYFYGNEYRLSGTEAAVVLRVSADKLCNPQQAIILNLETASGEVFEGYPLMDAAISGEYVTDTVAGQAITVYKRFQYDANNPADYLTLTHFHNGQAVKAYFLLESSSKMPPKPTMAPSTNTPQPDVTPTLAPLTSYPTLVHGDRGDAVVKLQEILIEQGYLTGEADGIFGNMTLTAVKEAQRIANMEQTGIADNDFQQYLFSNDVQ